VATKLGDLADYFSPGLSLTVRGREYTIPLASAELGLWCRTISEATGAVDETSTPDEMRRVAERMAKLPELPGEMSLAQRLLGSAYDEMVADRVEDVYIEFCTQTAYIWVIAGEEAAARWWQSGGRPEALRPATNRAERRAGGTSTAGDGATRPQASTSGTTSRTRSGRRRRNR
jgi:hypothetical protein